MSDRTKSSDPSVRASLSRRDFLKTGLGTGALLLLAGCAPAAPAAPTSAPAKPAPAAPTSAPAAAPTTAAAPISPAAATKPSMDKVAVLYNIPSDPTGIPDVIAFNHLKSDYGIEVNRLDVTGADATIMALVANQAQFSLSSFASGVLAVGAGQKIKAVTSAATACYFTFVTGSDITDWSQLKGKSIGMTATSDSSYWILAMELQKNNVDPKSIKWVQVRGSEARVTALAAGKIDAALVTIGGALELLKDKKFKRFADVGKDLPNLLFNGYWTNDTMISQHPDVVEAFVESVMKAHRDIQDKSKFMAAAQDTFKGKISDDVISQSYDILMDMKVWDPNESRWNNDAGEYTSKEYADSGAVDKYVPFSSWATTQFTDAARKKLGEFKA